MHHKHLERENRESFGMFIVAGKYWKNVKHNQVKDCRADLVLIIIE